MNLFETIKLIQDTAKETVSPKLIAIPNDPESHFLIIGDSSEKVSTPFMQQPRRHRVESIESFAAAFDRWAIVANPDAEGQPIASANIWIDLDEWQLSFFTDEPLRRSSVTLKLTSSPQLDLVSRFNEQLGLDQKALVRMLRHDLADCVDAGVLAAFRSIDFQKMINARQNLQHEKQSLDTDIVAQVTGEKKPDSFVVELPLFAMRELADAKTRIGITIDIDCDNRKFILQAKPGQIEMAMDDAREAVLTRLQTALVTAGHSDVVILAGTPNG